MTEVGHDPTAGLFYIDTAEGRARLDYILRDGGRVHFLRTWVPPAARGGGLGVSLVAAGLDWARSQGYRVTTSCWFVEEFFERSPEYSDLRAD